MNDSRTPEQVRGAFSPTLYITPYLLLVIANTGLQKAPAYERPVLFCVFAALGALGAVSTGVRLRRMWRAHLRHALPGWTIFLGAVLGLYGLYVAGCFIDGIAK
ncbi:hypothetical protein [Streptomyces chartreusis]|uniref:hypothetical protein n=1 Tax=Streptomyces chartreusis TaxID=1969 RepID=UPI00363761B3